MSKPAPAARLARFLVGCHPRRWRERYGDEVLDVLEQHRAGARTVLDLCFSAADAHLDPAWHGRPTRAGLRRGARAALPYALLLTVFGVILGILVIDGDWRDNHWSPDSTGGVTVLAFAPGRPVLVSAVGFDINGLDTVWDIADPARPRALASFEGGSPTAISPDGRTVATLSYHNQPVLWDLADPARPVKVATLPGYPDAVLWGQAFSPDGRVLAAAYDSRVDLWDVTDPGRPRRLASVAVDAAPPGYHGFPGGIAFSPSGRTLACTTRHDQVGLWDVSDPGRPVRVATLGGHTAPVAAVAFSPGGHLLADVGYDGAVTVFDLTGGTGPVRTATLHTLAAEGQNPDGSPDYGGTRYTLAFSPDGRTLTAIAGSTAPGPVLNTGPDTFAQTASRWSLTPAGAATAAATIAHSVSRGDAGQLALAADGRLLARGAPWSGTVTLTALP